MPPTDSGGRDPFRLSTLASRPRVPHVGGDFNGQGIQAADFRVQSHPADELYSGNHLADGECYRSGWVLVAFKDHGAHPQVLGVLSGFEGIAAAFHPGSVRNGRGCRWGLRGVDQRCSRQVSNRRTIAERMASAADPVKTRSSGRRCSLCGAMREWNLCRKAIGISYIGNNHVVK